jgi:DNA polymerase I
MKLENYTVLDKETTTYNKGHPFDPRNQLVSYSYQNQHTVQPVFKYHRDPGFGDYRFIPHGSTVVGFNLKFDLHWSSINGLDLDPLSVWDCQLAEYVLSGQTMVMPSLDGTLESYGMELKKSVVKDMWEAGVQTTDIPVNILEEYGNWDVSQTEGVFKTQLSMMSPKQITLVMLMGEDLKVLQHMEASGILFDKENAKKRVDEVSQRIAEVEEQLAKRLPPIQHGVFNWDSGDHLSCFLYGGTVVFPYAIGQEAVYKSGDKKGQSYIKNSWFKEVVSFPQRYVPLEGTEIAKTKGKEVATRLYSTDSPTLLSLSARSKEQKEVLSLLNQRSKLMKVVEMIQGVFEQFAEKQWQNNLIHGQYNQTVARTGRLTSSAPNMQNSPPELEEFFVSRYD